MLWDKTAGADTLFEIDDAHAYLPIPFLDALLHDIRHPKRLRALGLEDHLAPAVATLNRVDRTLFRARMTFPTIDEETTAAAITYFYEPFLEAFDPKLREDLGVWYTPPEIVRYQVRRVHYILKNDLGRSRGLADPDVVVLDPCCGTGAYLLEVARCIAEEARADGDEASIGLELSRAFHERVSPTLGDALNAGYGYLEVRCLGCDTHQTVALDVVRRAKTTPIHELERYMRCKGLPVQAQPPRGAAAQ